jgi:cytochrome b6-f complex iron-sulfur subunit
MNAADNTQPLGSGAVSPGVTRRLATWLIGLGLGGLVGSMFYSVIRFVIPPKAPEVSAAGVKIPWKASEMARNSGRIFRFGNQPGILVKTGAGDLRAFTAVCTHLACTVQYRPDLEHIWCACHNGHFDLTGRNIAGPPPRPLAPYGVNVKGDEVTVSRA